MRINNKGQIVYTAGCVGIVYKTEMNIQKFYGGEIIEETNHQLGKDIKYHTEEINCIAICPERRFIASGQVGMKPWVFIWNSYTW